MFISQGGSAKTPAPDATSNDNAMDILEGLGISGNAGDIQDENPSPNATETDETDTDIDISDDVENELIGDKQPQTEMEIKGDKKTVKFKLDANDKELKRTLEWGLAAPRFVRERKEAQQQLTTLKAESAALTEKASRIDEVSELITAGRLNLAVKTLLGEEGFKKFYTESVLERVKYDTADNDEERHQIAQKFRDAEREDERFLSGRDINRIKAENQKLVSKEEGRLQRATAASEHARYRFDEVDSDPVVQEAMSGKLWKLAMADIEEWVSSHEGKVVPTKEHYKKAFSENYKFLTGSRKAVDSKREVIATKQTQKVEKKKAGEVAKSGAPNANKNFDSLGIFDRLDWLKQRG